MKMKIKILIKRKGKGELLFPMRNSSIAMKINDRDPSGFASEENDVANINPP